MSQESPSFAAGTVVDARGERWRVVESVEHDDCCTCRLVGVASSNLGVGRALILPFDRPRPVTGAWRCRRVGRRRWVAGLRAVLASDVTAWGVRGAAAAGLDLLDYQLEPAIACARGVMRLLLADEVGLGKTVQAGLILADLRARADSARCLILCPASLCGQWQRELADRFGLPATVVDLDALRSLFRCSDPERAPWDRLPLAIASVDFVKRPEVLQGLARVRWDLLVVDEAHLSALAPERAAAVNWLARRSRRVALLTATPHPGEPGAFEALCRVGRLAGEEPITMFRRTRAALGMRSDRRVRVLRVRLSPAERRLHAALRRYTSRVWKTGPAVTGGDARLAMIVLAKRAASGPAPLLASLERRMRWLGEAEDEVASQLLLPLGEPEQDEADEEPAAVLAAPGLAHRPTELAILEHLVRLARTAVEFDSKGRALCRLIRRVREPAIVFTEYRDALNTVAGQLDPTIDIAVVHGGLDRRARAEAVRSFTEGSARLLLATDAAAHGLNLQARCRIVINLDLPWNPVRLEQRIGRVDRIGQRRVVHAVHVVGRGTTESVVLRKLELRTLRARQTLGDSPDVVGSRGEIDVADAVFGVSAQVSPGRTEAGDGSAAPGLPREANASVRRIDLSEEARTEVKRLTFLRQLRGRDPGSLSRVAADMDRASLWWTRLRLRPAAAPRLLAVFRAAVVDGRGLLVADLVVPLQADVRGRLRFVAAPALHSVAAHLERSAAAAAQQEVARLEVLLRPRLDADLARERALAEVVEAVPIVATQPGLFDARAIRDAEAEGELRALLSDETRSHLDDLTRAARLELAAPPRPVLLAFVRGG